ncbi:MAG: TIGR00266 family protein [Oscillospiraceae bacterium]|jgi:uncharacterized protein (TIGR00266 family)|nr:TIGR00266 family protein [Oscillospiraceae bacterium]
MRYTIEGNSLPVVICDLEPGEAIISENGGRTWSRGDIVTETKGGGLGKMFGRMLSGESLFLSHYTARSQAQIAFASSFPGSIVAKELGPGESIICQKSAFMASTDKVTLSTAFQKKLGAGLFGGEGFIMQKITGPGIVFLEIDGYASTIDLRAGERLVADTGVVAIYEESCTMSVETVKGVKNLLLGGEGVFDTIITGPGKVVVQSMPISSFAARISSHISVSN